MGLLQRRPGLLSVLPSWRLAALLGLADVNDEPL